MFEREIYWQNETSDHSIVPLVEQFCRPHELFDMRSHMSWSEHCSECVMPQCFTSCAFYAPRLDMKCNRFKDGIGVLQDDSEKSVLDITFKNWGKFEAVGGSKIMGLKTGAMYETVDRVLQSSLSFLPLPYGTKREIRRKTYSAKNKIVSHLGAGHVLESDAFFIEIANPGNKKVKGNFTIRNTSDGGGFFQKSFDLEPGYHAVTIQLTDIIPLVNLNGPYVCTFDPMAEEKHVRLLFGMMDFVKFGAKVSFNQFADNKNARIESEQASSKKAKCVVWDLDNTLWKGVFVEDGVENLKVNQSVINFVRDLDKKGILNSVASKNNPEEVLQYLKKLKIDNLFLYPQISWKPKSLSISNIQKSLNIGIDTFIFVDDQAFEREEVQTSHPDVRVFDILDIDTWKNDSAFDVDVTSESARRREMYRDQIVREEYLEQQGDNQDYEQFLKNCEISITVEKLSEATIRRAYELAQRTNQMNFSGTRYSIKQIEGFLEDELKEVSLIRCTDRFGDYGIVGLAVFDLGNKLIEDLMFSCRIQSKYVDHAVLVDFSRRFGSDLQIAFRPTPKNAKSAVIFQDLDFEVVDEANGGQKLQRPVTSSVLENDIVEVHHDLEN